MKAFLIGFCSGLRAGLPLAVISRIVPTQALPGPLAPIGSPRGRQVLASLAAFELVGDKLPFAPRRTKPAGLAARVTSGSIAAASISAASLRSVYGGAVLGAAGALTGTFVGYEARTRLVARLGRPRAGLAVAVSEDLLTPAGSIWVARQARNVSSTLPVFD